MSKCELCKAPARIYCESDLALLCWNCDAKVHSANFLVARHLRNLLCQVCQLPTPWNASGSRLTPGTSICIKCVSGCDRTKFGRVRVENEDIESGSSECMEEVIDENEDEDQLFTTTTDDDEENQVAPCSDVTPPPPTPPPAVLRRFWNSDRTDCLKRMRVNNPDLRSNDDDDDDNCSSCFGGSSSGISDLSSRALKLQRVLDTYGEEEERSGSKSATIIETVIEEQKIQKMLKVGDDEETTAAIDGGNRKRRFL